MTKRLSERCRVVMLWNSVDAVKSQQRVCSGREEERDNVLMQKLESG